MTIELRVLRSGSQGNTTLVRTADGTNLLIDAGVGPRTLTDILSAHGVEPRHLGGVLFTHAHGDHARGPTLDMLAAHGVPLYMTEGTWEVVAPRTRATSVARQLRQVEPGTPLQVGGLEVRACRVPHRESSAHQGAGDAVCYRVSDGLDHVGYATDLGHVPPDVLAHFADVGLLVLESNHDVGMLAATGRPDHVKSWIRGATGHLRNEQTAEALVSLFAGRADAGVVLAHLSGEANAPELALECSVDALRGIADIQISVAAKENLGMAWVLKAGQASPEQGRLVTRTTGPARSRSAAPSRLDIDPTDDTTDPSNWLHRCRQCGEVGHNSLTCPARVPTSPSRELVREARPRREYRCASCGGVGHNIATCVHRHSLPPKEVTLSAPEQRREARIQLLERRYPGLVTRLGKDTDQEIAQTYAMTQSSA